MVDFDVVVKGDIVLTDRVLKDGYVAIKDGRISHIGQGHTPISCAVHDFSGCLVMPGAIDGQVHSRSQHGQEDFIWSTRAAAAGGVTTIVDMPYDAGRLICSADRIRQKASEAGEQARVDFALYGTVHPDEGAKYIQEMVEAGVIGFKFSTFGTDPDRFPRIPPQVMHECFTEIAKSGLIASVHNENDEIIKALLPQVKASGRTDFRTHTLSRPAYSETLAIAEVYELAADTGCRAHIVHCSLGRGYELSAVYRAQGYQTTIEACLHYLMLNEDDDVARLGGRAKVNPPIRGREQQQALWHHLAAGNITIVSTDHVSWSLERKTNPEMLANASGATGLEVLYPLLVQGCLERGISIHTAAQVLAENPAQLFGLDKRKGSLTVGKDADIAILAPHASRYDPTASGHNFVNWSPYEGMDMSYRVAATFLRGQQVFDGETVLASPGYGKFITPSR